MSFSYSGSTGSSSSDETYIIPDALISYGKQNPPICEPTCGKATQLTSLAIASLGISGIFFLDGQPSQITLSSFEVFAGAATCWVLLTFLNREKGDVFKSFISDYATSTFLIASQVYLNLNGRVQNLGRLIIFGILNVHGGIALAAYIDSALRGGRGKDFENSLIDEYSKGSYPRWNMPLDSSRKRRLFAGAISVLGVGTIAMSESVKPLKIFSEFSLILIGDSIARLLIEWWSERTNRQYSKERKVAEENTLAFRRLRTVEGEFSGSQLLRGASDDVEPLAFSLKVRFYLIINRICLRLFHVLPAPLIVGAGVAAQRRIVLLSKGIYVLVGLVMGLTESLKQIRFAEAPSRSLKEVVMDRRPSFPPKTAFSWFKWVVGGPLLLTFIGLTISGYDPSTNTFATPNPFTLSAVAGFAVALYTSYLFSEWVRVSFLKGSNHPKINMAYYVTHYASNVPLLFLYLMEKFSIDDKAINGDSRFAAILTTCAWSSLGWALGREASGRFDSPHPHPPSALYFGLFTRYWTNLLANRFRNT